MIFTLRCLVVWCVATAVAATTAWWSLTAVGPLGSFDRFDRFDQLVTAVAGAALAGCAGWAWVVCTVVVARALVGLTHPDRPTRSVRGVPTWAARAVLAACGVAVLAGVPAQASGPDLDGLPFPDRAVGPAHPHRTAPVPAAPQPAPQTHVVRRGDSLWQIAAAHLPADASDAEVAAATALIHELNRDAVGPDPDLIHPGLRLRVPGS